MASVSSASPSEPTNEGSRRRLSELLQEQQEPFKLEVYLHERGFKRKSLGLEGTLVSNSKLSAESKKSGSAGAVKICSRIARDLCKRLACKNEIVKLKGFELSSHSFKGRRRRRKKNGKEATAMEDQGRLSSSGSFSAELNCLSESDTEDRQSNHQNDDDAEERMVQWRMMEENKQCSPVSVLDEIEMISNEASSGQELEEHISRLSFRFPNMKKVTEECIFSASLWEMFMHKGRNKRNVVGTSEIGRSKKTLQETRQLLFDCVSEAVESKKSGSLLGAEKLGKIICEKVKSWDKNSVNGKRMNKLIRSEFLISYQEQESLEGVREEIVEEIGDRILEEIKDEMADEVVNLYLCKAQRFSS